ncbi:MAG: hypothetical protein IJC74_05935 [Clostridia bacterium]|nr:hypothetical protein [Clostridia bacterium]
MSRLNIFVGHYGSGKTEVSLNYAMELKKQGKDVIIVDLDIVNAFYRTKDAEKILNEAGIEVITPQYANTNVDIPALPADIFKIFTDKSKTIVIDVGGDDDGAVALGRFFGYISQEDYKLNLVVNTKRPLTDTKENIILMLRDIESCSRLKVNGIINNSNLSYDTTTALISEGEKTVKAAADELGVEFVFTAVKEELYDEYLKLTDAKVFPLKKYLKMPWQIQ